LSTLEQLNRQNIKNRTQQTFSALRHRNFRLFWTGQFISLIGTWMQTVAQGWLVLQLTNSAFLLGLVNGIGSLPVLLFSLPGGVVADRVKKRNLLIATQSTAMVLAFLLAFLTYLHLKGGFHLKVWYVVAIAAAAGSAFALDAPARQSFFIEMVGKKDLLNAIALNSAIFNGARVIGPALAGVLIGVIGMAGCFFLNGVSYIAVIIGLYLIRTEHVPAARRDSPWQDMKQGLQYAWNNKVIRALVIIVAIFSIFGMPYVVLMPIFARDILQKGAGGLGFLMTSTGVGALAGALGLASLGGGGRKGRMIFWAGMVFCAAELVFSISRSYALSLAVLPVLGVGMVSQVAVINSSLQTLVPDGMRGRVMGVFTLMFMGMMPFGSFISGTLASRWGAPFALQAGLAVCVLTSLAAFRLVPELWEL
jgi:MFS family permease